MNSERNRTLNVTFFKQKYFFMSDNLQWLTEAYLPTCILKHFNSFNSKRMYILRLINLLTVNPMMNTISFLAKLFPVDV